MRKPKIVKTSLDEPLKELVKRTNHKVLGIWALECAERVLPHFEQKYTDPRPKKALVILQEWIDTGRFSMATIRKASLDAHAAAREVESDDVARSIARATGQAVATAHVPTHALGSAQYAATAIRDLTDSTEEVHREREWQYNRLKQLAQNTSNTGLYRVK